MTTSTGTRAPAGSAVPAPPRGPLGRIIVSSMATGAAGAAALTLAILPDAPEATVVGSALAAFGAGWAMMAWLSTRLTTRPQRWAYVPAAALGGSGGALLAFAPAEPTMSTLAWVWAPALVVLGAWLARRTHQGIPGPLSLLVYPVTFAMVVAGLGGLYEAVATPPQVAAGAMPGRLVDVGGYRLHLSCTGTGAPTVLLLNGLAQTSPQWARVQPAVARTARVCVYDRAGQAWSDDSPHRADSTHAALDLHRLLTAANEPGPYVLTGHSSGGLHALTYAAMYPDDVAGVVLLDSASPHQAELVQSFDGEYQLVRRALAVAPTLFRFGIGHVARAMTTTAAGDTAAEQAAVFAKSPRGMRNMRAEQTALPDAFRQAQALATLGATPLVVLTSKDNVDNRQGWGTAQDQLAALSTNARHTVAALGHMAFLEDPAGAAQSVQAIADVVTSARDHTALRTP